MKDLHTIIGERAKRGELNSLYVYASGPTGPAKKGTPNLVYRAGWKNPKTGALSTGDHEDPVQALMIALKGGNAGVNQTKKRSDARPKTDDSTTDSDFDFG